MYNNYTFLPDGNIAAYDDKKGVLIKDNSSNIRKELELENEIEYLDNELQEQNQELSKIPNDKSLNLRKKIISLSLILGAILVYVICKPLQLWLIGPFPISNSPLPLIKDVSDISLLFLGCPYLISMSFYCVSEINGIKKTRIKALKLKSSINYLELQIKGKKEELELLQNRNKEILSIDSEVHTLVPSMDIAVFKKQQDDLNNYLDKLINSEFSAVNVPDFMQEDNMEYVVKLVKEYNKK